MEVAQVVATGHAISPEAENSAVISKMIRVMMLAPFLLILSAYLNRKMITSNLSHSKPTIVILGLQYFYYHCVHKLFSFIATNFSSIHYYS